MNKHLIRLWFGAVRTAADAGEQALPKEIVLNPLQKLKLQILLRQNLCDVLALLIRDTERTSGGTAEQMRGTIYSELMEDAVAGVWSEEEELDFACFLSKCSAGIGSTENFCSYFRSILDEENDNSQQTLDSAALLVKKSADKRLESFAKAQAKRNALKDTVERESPPPGMDEFEYIDWLISH